MAVVVLVTAKNSRLCVMYRTVPFPAGNRGKFFASGVSQRSVVFAASSLLILVTEVCSAALSPEKMHS